MKKIIFSLAAVVFFGLAGMAQPQPGSNGGGGNVGGDPIGGGAPVGGGLAIMLVMGAAYGFKKTKIWDKKN